MRERRAIHSFCHHQLTTARRILAAGWDFLVNPIMREGGYVRAGSGDARRSSQRSPTAIASGSRRVPED